MKDKFKKIHVSLPEEDHERAKVISKEILGKVSVSGLFVYLINRYHPKAENPEKFNVFTVLEKKKARTENLTKFGNWKILPDNSLEHIGQFGHVDYSLYPVDMENQNWIEHMNDKTWCREEMADFLDAYFQALRNLGIKKITVPVRSY